MDDLECFTSSLSLSLPPVAREGVSKARDRAAAREHHGREDRTSSVRVRESGLPEEGRWRRLVVRVSEFNPFET